MEPLQLARMEESEFQAGCMPLIFESNQRAGIILNAGLFNGIRRFGNSGAGSTKRTPFYL
jgi:hypothetical protein